MAWFKKNKLRKEIDYLVTSDDKIYKACKKGEFIPLGFGYIDSAGCDECSITHVGGQVYLIGYFDAYKDGSFSAIPGQNEINQFKLLFPGTIKEIVFK